MLGFYCFFLFFLDSTSDISFFHCGGDQPGGPIFQGELFASGRVVINEAPQKVTSKKRSKKVDYRSEFGTFSGDF